MSALVASDGDGWDDGVDCDDGDPDVYPGRFEVCDDGVDQDCDGADTRSEPGNLELLGVPWTADIGGDYVGSRVSSAGDFDGDGYDDALVQALPGEDWGAPVPRQLLVRGQASPTSGTIDAISDWTLRQGGYAMAGAGDLDGDGYDDFAVSSTYEASGLRALVGMFFGPSLDVTEVENAATVITSDGSASFASDSIAGVGDVDGDGATDLLLEVGTTEGSAPGDQAMLMSGPLAEGATYTYADATLVLQDAAPALTLFAPIQVGGGQDLDGDGQDEIALAQIRTGADEEGAVYVFSAPPAGVLELGDADTVIRGDMGGLNLGYAMALIGDRDGDGYAELAATSLEDDRAAYGAGAGWVWSGPLETALEPADASLTVQGGEHDSLGMSIADAGDALGGDGHALLIGSYQSSVRGTTYGNYTCLLAGDRVGIVSSADCDLLLQSGEATLPGAAVAGSLDFDGDGRDDLLIGAPADAAADCWSPSAAWLVPGSAL